MDSQVFTQEEMEHLTTSFTPEELEKISTRYSRKELVEALDRYGRSRRPLAKTFPGDELTGRSSLSVLCHRKET